MNPDEKAEDPAGKGTFDPTLVNEEGYQAAQDAEFAVVEQEQMDQEVQEKPGRSGNWQTFKTS
jgi:hypothetical protein